MVALVKKYGSRRILISSAADRGVSDPLKVPKTAALMRVSDISERSIEEIVWNNPIAFFSQSGKLAPAGLEQRPPIDHTRRWEGNTIFRGQPAIADRNA